MASVAIIGAGIAGLSTAFYLKKSEPSISVTIITKDLSPRTCSDVAAGLWIPYMLRKTPNELQRKWSDATYDFASELLKRPDASEIGVAEWSGYQLFDVEQSEFPEWQRSAHEMRFLTMKEMKNLSPKCKSGYFFKTYTMEGGKYLPWLLKKFREMGETVEIKQVHSFDELADSYDVVVNCTGFGAREFCGDHSLEPIRGQVTRVKAPWIKHFYLMDFINRAKGESTYIIPNLDSVVLGGTAQVGNFNEEVDKDDKERILRETAIIVPSLANAEFICDKVGLRPSRPTVRLEMEEVPVSGSSQMGKKIKVVHNYGHGGAGITLHWGCAADAVQLVLKCMDETKELRPFPVSKL